MIKKVEITILVFKLLKSFFRKDSSFVFSSFHFSQENLSHKTPIVEIENSDAYRTRCNVKQ